MSWNLKTMLLIATVITLSSWCISASAVLLEGHIQYDEEIGVFGVHLVAKHANLLVFLYPYHNSPAEKVGIEDGDLLYMVDGIQISANIDGQQSLPIGQVRSMLIKQPHIKSTVIIRRGAKRYYKFEVERQDPKDWASSDICSIYQMEN